MSDRGTREKRAPLSDSFRAEEILLLLKYERIFDPIRQDPRFIALERKLGLLIDYSHRKADAGSTRAARTAGK